MASTGTDETSPWTRPRFLVAAALVLLLVIAGIVLAVLPSNSNGPTPTPSPSSTPTPSQSATPAAAGESKCGLPAGSQTTPAAPPAGATWELFGTFAAPSIEDVGPGVVDPDGVRSCFAHSPTGALLAAINFWAMTGLDLTLGVDPRLTADTPERAALAEQYAAEPPTPSTGVTYQVAGFQFRGVTDDSLVVDVAIRTATGAVGVVPTPLRWEDGDWKLVVPASGDTGTKQLPNLAGFVLWAGV